MSLNFEPVPYEEAARIIAEKQVMSKEAFDALCDELKARAFVVTGLEDLRMVQEIRDAIAEMPRGTGWEDVKRQVVEKLEEGGFSEEAADYRATLLLRHHGFAAYAQENYRELREMQDAFPYWKYQTMGDEKVRDTHAALDGLILPADDPFWRNHFPPWEWNCRCMVVGVTEEDYKGAQPAGSFDATDPDAKAAGWTLPPALRARLDQGLLDDGSGHPVNVTRQSSFHFDPSGPGLDLAEIQKRYDPADWAAFRARMEAEKLADGRSVWEWATGKKAAGGAGGTPAGTAGETPAPPGQAGRTTAPRQDRDTAKMVPVAETRARLAEMEVAQVLPNPARGTNESRILVGMNGERAVFKPEGGESKLQLRAGIKPGTQHRREAAASIVDEALGTRLVPPTAMRTVDGKLGSVQEMVKLEPRVTERERTAILRGEAGERLYLLDEVLGSLDRKHNIAFARGADGMLHPVAIDNGLCLPTETIFAATAAKEFEGTSRGQFRNKDIPEPLMKSLRRFQEREAVIRATVGELLGDEANEALDGMFGRVRVLLRGKHYLKAERS